MPLNHRLLAVGLSAFIGLFVVAPNAWAQERHVVDPSAMKAAVTAKAHDDDADRSVVHKALQSPEAQTVADRFGLDLRRADDAVSTMSPAELHAIVPAARVVTASGGDEIDISVTTLLLFLILIVLLIR